MAHKDVKVCGGLLVIKSESGEPKVEKVLVETRPGRTKKEIKCRIQNFVKDKFPSKISALIIPRKKESNEASDSSLKSLHSSLIHFRNKDQEDFRSCLSNTSGDFTDVGKKLEMYDLTVPKPNNILVTKNAKNEDRHEETEISRHVFQPLFTEEKIIKSENYDSIDDDIISSSNHSEVQINEPTDEENKDSTIHFTYDDSDEDFESDDDDFNFFPKKNPKDKKRQDNQTSNTDLKQTLRSSEDDKNHENDEDFEPILSEESSSESSQSYIDSGLRPLKSDESRLILDPAFYKKKKKPPSTTIQKQEIKPLLTELSSDLFQSSKKGKHEQETSKAEEEEEESSEDLESRSDISEESDLDEATLNKLKKIGDKKIIFDTSYIITNPIPDKKVETKSKNPYAPIVQLLRPSSRENSQVTVPSGKTSSRGDFYSNDALKDKSKSKFSSLKDFCVCEADEDDISPIIFPNDSSSSCVCRSKSSSSLTTPSKSSLLSRDMTRSKRQGFSSITLIDNKETRRSKYSKMRMSKN